MRISITIKFIPTMTGLKESCRSLVRASRHGDPRRLPCLGPEHHAGSRTGLVQGRAGPRSQWRVRYSLNNNVLRVIDGCDPGGFYPESFLQHGNSPFHAVNIDRRGLSARRVLQFTSLRAKGPLNEAHVCQVKIFISLVERSRPCKPSQCAS